MIPSDQWIELYHQYRRIAYDVFSWSYDKNIITEYGDYATHLAIGTYDESHGANLSTHVWYVAMQQSQKLRRQMIHEKRNISYTETPDENGCLPTPLAKCIHKNRFIAWVDAKLDTECIDRYLLENEAEHGNSARRMRQIINEHAIDGKTFRDIGKGLGISRAMACKIYAKTIKYLYVRYRIDEKASENKRNFDNNKHPPWLN